MDQKKDIRSFRERVGMSIEVDSQKTLVDAIVEAEQAGVEQIWVGAPPWKLETLTALAAAAMRTTHIKLGTSVLQVFARHPVGHRWGRESNPLSQFAVGEARILL